MAEHGRRVLPDLVKVNGVSPVYAESGCFLYKISIELLRYLNSLYIQKDSSANKAKELQDLVSGKIACVRFLYQRESESEFNLISTTVMQQAALESAFDDAAWLYQYLAKYFIANATQLGEFINKFPQERLRFFVGNSSNKLFSSQSAAAVFIEVSKSSKGKDFMHLCALSQQLKFFVAGDNTQSDLRYIRCEPAKS